MADTGVTTVTLAERINRDRIARRMKWAAYAEWMGIRQSTLYKISRGVSQHPHELTMDQIERKLAEPIVPATAPAGD